MQKFALLLVADSRQEQGTPPSQSESLKQWSYEQRVPKQPGGPQLAKQRPLMPIVQSESTVHSVAGA
jgi:hypothetical protein